jgi:hypothetical protein
MNPKRLIFAAACLVTPVFLTGCNHQVDAKTELEKAATVLDQPSVASGSPTAEAPPPPTESPAAVPEPVAGLAATPAQEMHLAISSYKTGELEDAVTRLQKLRATPTLTAEQRMAVQDSVAAVMTEICTLAAKGDPKAIQAVKQYELMQTTR